jgi:hypothetical protein
MAAKPYTLSALIRLPPDDGQEAGVREFSTAGVFSHKVEAELVFTGTGTHVVNFGSIPSTGAKAILLEYEATDSSDQDPLLVSLNGSEDTFPVFSGGGLMLSNPLPAGAGVTALSVTYAAACIVKVTLLA